MCLCQSGYAFACQPGSDNRTRMANVSCNSSAGSNAAPRFRRRPIGVCGTMPARATSRCGWHLREAAFARSPIGVRRWTPVDFARELTAKPWWRPEALWFASTGRRIRGRGPVRDWHGNAWLARIGPQAASRSFTGWRVLPAYRTAWSGPAAGGALEQLVWHSGGREICARNARRLDRRAWRFYRSAWDIASWRELDATADAAAIS